MTSALRLSSAGLSRDDLPARVPDFAAGLAADAARRDQERDLTLEAFARFRELGLGALCVPVTLGGMVRDCYHLPYMA